MFKTFLAIVAALFAAAAFAAVDVNKATQAELEAVKGIGPGIAGKILDERKKGSFKDWTDFVDRVKGVGEGNAAKFSAEGLTVGGAGFKGAAVAPAKKDDKPAAKPAAAPATPATPAAPAAKPAEKAVAAAPAMKADAKLAAKDEKKPAADEKKAKADKPAAAASAAKK